jgi:hypothetical protein
VKRGENYGSRRKREKRRGMRTENGTRDGRLKRFYEKKMKRFQIEEKYRNRGR